MDDALIRLRRPTDVDRLQVGIDRKSGPEHREKTPSLHTAPKLVLGFRFAIPLIIEPLAASPSTEPGSTPAFLG